MASTPFGFEEILYEATLHFTKVTDYGFSVANVSRESPGEYSESGVHERWSGNRARTGWNTLHHPGFRAGALTGDETSDLGSGSINVPAVTRPGQQM